MLCNGFISVVSSIFRMFGDVSSSFIMFYMFNASETESPILISMTSGAIGDGL